MRSLSSVIRFDSIELHVVLSAASLSALVRRAPISQQTAAAATALPSTLVCLAALLQRLLAALCEYGMSIRVPSPMPMPIVLMQSLRCDAELSGATRKN